MKAASKKRCRWVNLKNPLSIKYHDQEWGYPVRSDQKHFEHLSLEVAQAGLNWEMILNRRESYRDAFDSFDFNKIAKYSSKKANALLKNSKIIRNRLKIEATINNAKAFIKIRKEFGSFNKYIWNFVNKKSIINRFSHAKKIPAHTKLSEFIAKDLKQRDFKFVGPITIYSHLQATGLINDHTTDCFRHPDNARGGT